MQQLYEAILKTNIINFLIVLSTLVFVFKKFQLGAILEKMAQDVKDKVEKSSLDAKNAIDEYKSIKKASKETPKLQEEIIEKAKSNAQNIKAEIEKSTSKKQDELNLGFEKTTDSLVEKYKKMTTSEIYLACVDLAKDEVIKRLDSEAHKKLINSSIDELDKIEGTLL